MKKGKLLKFPTKVKDDAIETTEGGLQRVFWNNVEKDIKRLAKLYLMEHVGATADAEEFAMHLVKFRHDQGNIPSSHVSPLQRAFMLAIAGERDKMHQLFCEEKTAIKSQIVRYDDPRYEAAVQKAVVTDTSEMISFAIDTWFSDDKRNKVFKAYESQENQDTMVDVLAEALKELVPTNGVDLRTKVEMRTGRAMRDDYADPSLKVKEPTILFKFPAPTAI